VSKPTASKIRWPQLTLVGVDYPDDTAYIHPNTGKPPGYRSIKFERQAHTENTD
jgi:hypothetical protein